MPTRIPMSRNGGFFKELTHQDTGTHRYPGHMWKWSDLELRWDSPAPRLGEDNEYVYKDLLGYTDDEYNELVEEGLINDRFLVEEM